MPQILSCFLVIAGLISVVLGQCAWKNIGGYDFNLGLNPGDVTVAGVGGSTFWSKQNTCNPIASPIDSNCPAGTLFCQMSPTSTTSFRKIANLIDTPSASAYNPTTRTLTMTYSGGDVCPNATPSPGAPPNARRAIVNYVCSNTTNSVVYVGENPTCTYTFTWTGLAGCGTPTGSGGSGGGGLNGGDVFLIIFFVGGFLYVAVGMAYNYKAKEARGVEMIPNLEFWKDLPQLLKDGASFAYGRTKSLCEKK